MEIGRGLRTDKVPSVPPASLELSEDRLVAGQPPGAPPEPAKRVPVPRPAGSDEPFTAAASAPPQPGPPPGRADEPTGRPTAGTPPAPTREAPAGAEPAMTARSRESMVGDQRGTSESAARLALEPARGPEPVPSPPPVPPRQETGATGSGTRDLPAYARQPTEARESRSTSSPPARADETLGRLTARMLAPDVTIRLVASDRAALSASLADLVARAGGAEAGRRPDGSDLVIEVVVPRAAYAEFAREVVRLGQTADVRGAPELPPAVRVLIRIAP
jgi:hypothetical protein